MLFGDNIAVDKDLIVRGVFFDHKGETAGLGANIKERFLYGRALLGNIYWMPQVTSKAFKFQKAMATLKTNVKKMVK